MELGLLLRLEHKLKMFEERELRGTFRSKRDEVTVSWRKLHDEKLHNFCFSPNIIRMIKSRMRWWGA
jgi:hypothetical protein